MGSPKFLVKLAKTSISYILWPYAIIPYCCQTHQKKTEALRHTKEKQAQDQKAGRFVSREAPSYRWPFQVTVSELGEIGVRSKQLSLTFVHTYQLLHRYTERDQPHAYQNPVAGESGCYIHIPK